MAETKDSSLNPLIREFNGLAPKSKITETTTFVSGAVAVGTTRIIKEMSCEIYISQDGVRHPWLAVRFTDGTTISLRSLMGVPSLEGFTQEGELPVDEYTGNTLPNGERETASRKVAPTSEGFDVKNRYKPGTWCVNDYLNREADALKGAKVTYRGTALKPYIVRRPFGNQVPNGRAVISVDLWEITPATSVK